MSLPTFSHISCLLNEEITQEILKTESIIFNLRFKKATRQTLKIHELKNGKRKLAQLKTLLKIRLKNHEINEKPVIENLVTK